MDGLSLNLRNARLWAREMLIKYEVRTCWSSITTLWWRYALYRVRSSCFCYCFIFIIFAHQHKAAGVKIEDKQIKNGCSDAFTR